MTLASTPDAVVAAATAVLALLALGGTVTALLVVRRARRRWRLWRSLDARARRRRVVERGVAAVAASPMSHPGWWIAQRERHRLWRAVTNAERTVVTASGAGAPVGDLPGLSRRLRARAESVDLLLGASHGGSLREAKAAVTEVVGLAEQVRRAAADALRMVSDVAGGGLADAIAVEVTALRHGLSSMR